MADNYILLERIELAASAASVTFSNIPQTGYTDLKVVLSVRTDRASQSDWLKVGFNGSTTGFTYRELEGTGSAANSYSGSGQLAAYVNSNSATANVFGNAEIYVPNFTSANYKSVSIDAVTEDNSSGAVSTLNAFLWSNTAAITSITFTPNVGPNIMANSTFSLYGLAAVGTTPAIAPKASGGNITTDGTYWYHTFLASGTFTPQINLACDYLVVAGGGGGGSRHAGGGGAGGYRTASSSLSASNYAVTIGSGGIGASSNSLYVMDATNGNDTVFNSITSTGGGKGGGNNGATPVQGTDGGSGGGGQLGAAGGAGNTPATSPSQGNNGGGSNGFGPAYGGGGGGGASQAGSSGSSSAPGNGGNGSTWLNGTTYAGGGGGGTYGTSTPGTGGTGGGGAGGISDGVKGIAGTVNTGGGGGGGGSDVPPNGGGGNGGSGVVIIRYLA